MVCTWITKDIRIQRLRNFQKAIYKAIISAENSISFGYIKRVRDSLSTVAEEFISYLNEECILNEER